MFSFCLNVVPSNPSVRPLPKIKISFPLLSICSDKLIAAPKMIIFLPMLLLHKKHPEQESNPMP